MSDDDRFDEMLREMARELDPPPLPPREAMWRVIDGRRADERARRRSRSLRPRFGSPPWARWAPALAAMLVLGIGIGRGLRPGGDTPSPAPTAAADTPTAIGYDYAALTHLASAEALLVAFPGDARAGRLEEVADWARELLTDTRLLADSPAADDPEVARLLGDLELLLVQIAALRGGARGGDVALIEDGIQENDVLLRIRTATTDVAAGL